MTWLRAGLTCLLASAGVNALYSANSAVVQLTDDTFSKKVLTGDALWLVEFYAPWCGHCKQLAPEWEKAAKALKGLVRVAAVDMDKYQSVGQPYGIQGFPTIKLFGLDKKKPIDYNQERSAKAIVDFALREAKNAVYKRMGGGGSSSNGGSSNGGGGGGAGKKGDVVVLTDANFEEEVLNSKDVVLVEFYAPWCGHCKNLEPEWAKAATALKGVAKIAALDATVHQAMAGKYNVRGYPTIKVFGANKKSPEDYNGPREAEGIVAFAKDLAERNLPPPEVYEVTSAAVWDEQCQGKNRICVVTILPHILDSSAKERKQQLSMLKKAAKRLKSGPFRWVWTEAGKQDDLADRLNMGGAGYPALVGVSVSKEKYSNMRSAFDEEHVVQFLNNLMSGKEPLGPIRNMPKIADAAAWDGKDGELPKEEL